MDRRHRFASQGMEKTMTCKMCTCMARCIDVQQMQMTVLLCTGPVYRGTGAADECTDVYRAGVQRYRSCI